MIKEHLGNLHSAGSPVDFQIRDRMVTIYHHVQNSYSFLNALTGLILVALHAGNSAAATAMRQERKATAP